MWYPKECHYALEKFNFTWIATKNHPLLTECSQIDRGHNFAFHNEIFNQLDGQDPLRGIQYSKNDVDSSLNNFKNVNDLWDITKKKILGQVIENKFVQIRNVKVEEDCELLMKEFFSNEEVSQHMYLSFLKNVAKEIKKLWNLKQRVKALKLTLQCSKLLMFIEQSDFYPAKFFTITEILDMFSELIYKRLEERANTTEIHDNCMEEINEMCKNWYFKISSIKLLIPRIYLSVTILKSYSIYQKFCTKKFLEQLFMSIRGVGNMLISSYIRCYLFRSVCTLPVHFYHDVLGANIDDFFLTYKLLNQDFDQMQIKQSQVSFEPYIPSIQLLWYYISSNIYVKEIKRMFDMWQKYCRSAYILNLIILYAQNADIINNVEFILEYITLSNFNDCSPYFVWETFIRKLRDLQLNPCDKKQLFYKVHAIIKATNHFDESIQILEQLTAFAVSTLTAEERLTFINSLFEEIHKVKMNENDYASLKNIIMDIILNSDSVNMCITSEQLKRLITYIPNESQKANICQGIIKLATELILPNKWDALTLHSLLFYSEILSKYISSSFVSTGNKDVILIFCAFISKAGFQESYEEQLEFYAKCRSALIYDDDILYCLIQCTNKLANYVHKQTGNNITNRYLSLMRGLIAFCYVTLLSLSNFIKKLKMLVLTGETALKCGCLWQSHSIFEEIVTSFENIWTIESTELEDSFVIGFISKFLSASLMIPDPPQKKLFYVKSLMFALNSKCWTLKSFFKAKIYIKVLLILCAYSQQKYLYSSSGIICGNDILYGSKTMYTSEIIQLGNQIINQLITIINEYINNQLFKESAEVTYEFLLALYSCCETKNVEITIFLKKLIQYLAIPEVQHYLNETMVWVVITERKFQVQTDVQRIDNFHFLFNIPDADNINHIVVFLTGLEPFPNGMSGAVYFSWPEPLSPPSWQYLGFISNEKPSAIFKISQLKQKESTTMMFGFGNQQFSHTAQIGISVEPFAQLMSLQPVVADDSKNPSVFIEFTNRMLENFFNYIASFSSTQNQIMLSPEETYIPLSVAKNWFELFHRRLSQNPYFWKN